MDLFETLPPPRVFPRPEIFSTDKQSDYNGIKLKQTSPCIDESVFDIYARAENPTDPYELRDLWVGRAEQALGDRGIRGEMVERWKQSKVRRSICADEILNSRATVKFIKELFNWYFRDDLYGKLHAKDHIILSSGAVDEECWGLSSVLKETLSYALRRDWYGYSDSRGRLAARDSIARFENSKLHKDLYSERNIAITMGATFAVNAIAEMVLTNCQSTSPALCGIPNYPPLVETISRRNAIKLVPLGINDDYTSLEPIITCLTHETPLILIQTVTNPTGLRVKEEELERLIKCASPSTIIILDESHEWLGPSNSSILSSLRAASNVVRVSSLSKCWSIPGMKIGWIVAEEKFISEYYEYASSTFGGPPSFFYTLIEVFCRMEAWFQRGILSLSLAELNEFEDLYGLKLDRLTIAYENYIKERNDRLQALTSMRKCSMNLLHSTGFNMILPQFSVNLTLELSNQNDSYLCFRQLLDKTGVSLFPGILNFYFAGGIMRATTAVDINKMQTAAQRIREYLMP